MDHEKNHYCKPYICFKLKKYSTKYIFTKGLRGPKFKYMPNTLCARNMIINKAGYTYKTYNNVSSSYKIRTISEKIKRNQLEFVIIKLMSKGVLR